MGLIRIYDGITSGYDCYIAMENPNHKWGFIAGKIIYKWENHL